MYRLIADDLRRSKQLINAALYNFNQPHHHNQVESNPVKPANQYQVLKVTTTTTTTSTTARNDVANRKTITTALPILTSKATTHSYSSSMFYFNDHFFIQPEANS